MIGDDSNFPLAELTHATISTFTVQIEGDTARYHVEGPSLHFAADVVAKSLHGRLAIAERQPGGAADWAPFRAMVPADRVPEGAEGSADNPDTGRVPTGKLFRLGPPAAGILHPWIGRRR